MAKHNYIRSLISQGEHQELDFKYKISDSRKIAISMVAFANTDGGKLLIGVMDDGKIPGIKSEEEKYMIEAAVKQYTDPAVTFTQKKWTVNGKEVLEVSVSKGLKRPYKALDEHNNWIAYIRRLDQNLVATGVLLKIWEKENERDTINIIYTDRERTLLKYLEENTYITSDGLKQLVGISIDEADDLLSDLVLMDIISMVITEKLTYYILNEGLL